MNENEFSDEDDEGSEEEVVGETESIFVTIESEYKTVRFYLFCNLHYLILLMLIDFGKNTRKR